MKHLSPVDKIFITISGIFAILCVYELVEFLQPYYNFGWTLIVFVIASFSYFISKNGGMAFLFSDTGIDSIQSQVLENDFLKPKISLIKQKKEYIVYGAFVSLMCIVFVSMLFDTGVMLAFSLIIFFTVYFVAKLCGFTLDFHIQKSSISSGNALRFFTITFGLFIVIVSLILNSFGISESERGLWYLLLGGAYLIIGAGIFFSWNLKIPKLFTTYNTLSLFLILGLFGFLAFQNGFLNVGNTQEDSVPGTISSVDEEIIGGNSVEEVGSEEFFELEQENTEIISQEVEIAYEARQVAQEYSLIAGIQLGSSGENVRNLQRVLGQLQYYTGEISGDFDEVTQKALSDALKGECRWPESTRGIFGPQAKACIDSLSISVAIN